MSLSAGSIAPARRNTVSGDMNTPGYNERIFGGGLRAYLHTGRFRWLRSRLADSPGAGETVIELGCFDGKLLEWLPHPPRRYLGIDANWEGGLDLAREKYAAREHCDFLLANRPDEIELDRDEFTLGVSMETLEHVPPAVLPGYLALLADSIRGRLLVTVPNEIGPVFALKWTLKKLFLGGAERYSPAEFFNAVLGRSHKVSRLEHKGFDYRVFTRELEQYFEVVAVDSIPFPLLPACLSFGIGIVAEPRKAAPVD